ncbi:hypothetical protein AALA98_07215 [Lachnospiraceae bacterium 45-W7]
MTKQLRKLDAEGFITAMITEKSCPRRI